MQSCAQPPSAIHHLRTGNSATVVGVDRTSQVLQEGCSVLGDSVHKVHRDVQDVSKLARCRSDELVCQAEGVGCDVGIEGSVLDVAPDCKVKVSLRSSRVATGFKLTVQTEEVVGSDVASE